MNELDQETRFFKVGHQYRIKGKGGIKTIFTCVAVPHGDDWMDWMNGQVHFVYENRITGQISFFDIWFYQAKEIMESV